MSFRAIASYCQRAAFAFVSLVLGTGELSAQQQVAPPVAASQYRGAGAATGLSPAAPRLAVVSNAAMHVPVAVPLPPVEKSGPQINSAAATAGAPRSSALEQASPAQPGVTSPEIEPVGPPNGGTPATTASYQQPVLDPNQPGNLDQRLDPNNFLNGPSDDSPVLDPNQAGNLDLRLNAVERRLQSAGGTKKDELPLIRLSGFFQLDEGLFSQSNSSIGQLGNIQNGVGFRRTRLQAIGKLTEFTGYSIEMDFATAGRPSFMDVWGEQSEMPFFGTVRIGQFRQPGTMDSWTSVRHLEFLERSLPFQALDPFRRDRKSVV